MIISTMMSIMRERPITSNYEKIQPDDKKKLDRRPFLIQNIKVGQSWMQRIYDQ